MNLRTSVGAVVLGLLVSYAGAQGTAAAGKQVHEVIANGGVIHTLLAAPVIGQPYSAMQVHRTSRKLTDGTTISHQGRHFVARDSQGRVRVELGLARGQNGAPDTVMVFVSDPVAQTMTIWSTGAKTTNKTASVVKLPGHPQTAPVQPVAKTDSTRPQPIIKTEDLGMESIEGLPVEAVRTTTIVPAGRSGNDAPITKTQEVWTSADLKLVMKEQWDDPRTGERIISLENFSRAEPDPALFRVPPGYVVKTALESLKELEERLSAMGN